MSSSVNLNTIYNVDEGSVTNKDYFLINKFESQIASNYSSLTNYVDNKVTEILGDAPDTLNTLLELATAVNLDANFALNIFNYLESNVSNLNYNIDSKASILYSGVSSNTSLLQSEVFSNVSILYSGLLSNTNLLQTQLFSNVSILYSSLLSNTNLLQTEFSSNVSVLYSGLSSNTSVLQSEVFSNVSVLYKELKSNISTLRTELSSQINTNNLYANQIDTLSSNLNIGDNANTINIGCSNSNNIVNIGTNNGQTSIYIGGPGDKVYLQGDVTTIQAQTTEVFNKYITLNRNGGTGSSFSVGFNIQDGNDGAAGYIKTSGDRNSYDFKVPGSNNVVKLTPSPSNNNDEVVYDEIVLKSYLNNNYTSPTVSQPTYSSLGEIQTTIANELFTGPGYYRSTSNDSSIILGGQSMTDIDNNVLIYVPANISIITVTSGSWYSLL